MTSGHMNCPKCGNPFQYMRWEKRGLFLEEIELPEPWECQKCKALVVTDKEKGYGLLVLVKEALDD